MNSHSQPDHADPAQLSLSTQGAQLDRLFGRSSLIAFIIIVVVAYLPLFLDARFFQRSLGFVLLVIGLGLLYTVNGTHVQGWLTDRLPWAQAQTLYFGAQLLLVLLLLYLTRAFNNNTWMLILPIGAQSIGLRRWASALVLLLLLGSMYTAYFWGSPLAQALPSLLSISAALIFTLLFMAVAVRESQSRSQIQALATELRQANVRLAAYAAQAEELATIQERNRLAREIHDNLGHYLTVINVQLEVGRTLLTDNPEKAQDALAKAQKLTQDGLGAVRHSISALRESPLANKRLAQAMQPLLEASQAAGILTELTVSGTERPLDPKTSLALYRAAQEGLTNIRKHARATRAGLHLDYSDPDRVQLTLEDNGVGSRAAGGGDSSDSDAGFGLMGMRERIELLGGALHLHTAPGSGFRLHITIPTPAA